MRIGRGPQRAANIVLLCHFSFSRLGVGSVGEVDELGRGLLDERHPPPDQAIARFGLFCCGRAHTWVRLAIVTDPLQMPQQLT